MDSITQLALGAAVGHAALGRRVGRRSLLWGAALGILPDLDVLVPMGDVIAEYTSHRSWSHSLFVLAAASPLSAWLATRVHPDTQEHRRGWHALAFLVFATHALLDCFTVYGTQIFWPLPRPPESWSTVFIIDPAYTLPLLLGVAGAWLWQRRRPRRASRLNYAGIALSMLYLAWTVAAKIHVDFVVDSQLARDGVQGVRVLTTPTPFNTLLWRVVLKREGGYAEGYYSMVAHGDRIEFVEYPSDDTLLNGLREQRPVERLIWFTHGFYSVARVDEEVVIRDLRMGAEPDYVFSFAVARAEAGRTRPVEPRKITAIPSLAMLSRIWDRIWNPAAAIRGG